MSGFYLDLHSDKLGKKAYSHTQYWQEVFKFDTDMLKFVKIKWHQGEAWIPRRNSKIPPQQEKNLPGRHKGCARLYGFQDVNIIPYLK